MIRGTWTSELSTFTFTRAEFTCDLPGVTKNEVDISHEGDVLTVGVRQRDRVESGSEVRLGGA